jgi:hypothetical protein
MDEPVWELACKRFGPVNGYCQTPNIAGKPAPTEEFGLFNEHRSPKLLHLMPGAVARQAGMKSELSGRVL